VLLDIGFRRRRILDEPTILNKASNTLEFGMPLQGLLCLPVSIKDAKQKDLAKAMEI